MSDEKTLLALSYHLSLITHHLSLITYHFFLLPGLTAGMPAAHCGQAAGASAGTSSVASATRGTPTSERPPERSMIDAAPTTRAPAARIAPMVSRVEPPVVITSSTTRTFSPGRTVKPRRRV